MNILQDSLYLPSVPGYSRNAVFPLPAGFVEVDLSALNGSSNLDVRDHTGAIVGEMDLGVDGYTAPSLTSDGLVFTSNTAKIDLTGGLDVSRGESSVFTTVSMEDATQYALFHPIPFAARYFGMARGTAGVTTVGTTAGHEFNINGSALSPNSRPGLLAALNGVPRVAVEIIGVSLTDWTEVGLGRYTGGWETEGTYHNLILHISGTLATASERAQIAGRLYS